MAKIYYVGDWAVSCGPVFAETPFNYAFKGLDLYYYGRWLKDALESKACVTVNLLQRLEGIGAVRQMHGCRWNVERIQVGQIPFQHSLETTFAGRLRLGVAHGVAVFALVGATAVHIQAVAVAAGEDRLSSERAVPVQDSWAGRADQFFLRPPGQEIGGQCQLLVLRQPIPHRLEVWVNPGDEAPQFVICGPRPCRNVLTGF